MAEIIVASIAAVASFTTAMYMLISMHRVPTKERVNGVESDLRGEIASLRKALDEHARRLKNCLQEKDDLKQENYRLYKELSEVGV